jgi:hypothetical protein
MLRNPFTPTEIASDPGDFFGRDDELRTLERSLVLGSVAIQGPVGIGKSSLLARGLLAMEGFGTATRARSVVAVGDRGVDDIEKAARLLLHSLVDIDENQKRVKFRIGSLYEHESAEITRNFVEGRHLAILKRLVEQEYVSSLLANDKYLILAIDEADKCPMAIARLARSILTHTQQQGVKRVRFLLAGVRPFFQHMVDEDTGVARFFYKTISLEPMPPEEATELVEAKLTQAVDWAREDDVSIEVDPEVIERVVALSGGHPHLLQLLGSHLIEHEDEDPDGVIDSRDLANSLRRICYEDRARVYNSTLHELEVHGRLEALEKILELAPTGFPTSVDRRAAARVATPEEVHWLTEHNIIVARSDEEYGLVDEFLRIRMIMDNEESEDARAKAEQRMIDRLYRNGMIAEASDDEDEDE